MDPPLSTVVAWRPVPSDSCPDGFGGDCVCFVGAGPSGLMTAMALARLGIKTKIIDRRFEANYSIV